MGLSLFHHEPAPELPLLDVRREADFLAGHAADAASIPLEELPVRTHELPPSNVALRVTDAQPARASEAAGFLRRRGHAIVTVPFDSLAHSATGPARSVLWRANPFLVEALERIQSVHPSGAPRAPRQALDVACGTGRDAVWLAMHGYDVLALDVLPDALDRASQLARHNAVCLQTVAMDVETGPTLPPGAFDLVTVFRFLHRPLFPLLRQAVAPGGCIIYETFHEQNRATGLRPQNPAHLLRTGELAGAFAGFDILIARDAVERDGRYFSSLLARKPTT